MAAYMKKYLPEKTFSFKTMFYDNMTPPTSNSIADKKMAIASIFICKFKQNDI